MPNVQVEMLTAKRLTATDWNFNFLMARKIGIVINSTLGEQYVKKSSTSSTD